MGGSDAGPIAQHWSPRTRLELVIQFPPPHSVARVDFSYTPELHIAFCPIFVHPF